MGYLSILETSKKWGVSKRRIQILCAEERIPGATRIGNYWAIPDDAEKPKDARIKSGRYIKQRKNAEYPVSADNGLRISLQSYDFYAMNFR